MPERIWAPWRMEYIQAADGDQQGCVLCRYVEAEPSRETGVLVRWPRAYVVLNKYPYAAGHVMVVPSEHHGDLTDLEQGEYHELFELVRGSVACLRDAVNAEAMNVGVNLGRAAGAGIHEHVHVHLVPRWTGDHNFMPVLGGVRVLPELLEKTWDRLAPSFARLAGGPR